LESKILAYFTAIRYILQLFGIRFGKFCGRLVFFPPFLVYCTEENLATLSPFFPEVQLKRLGVAFSSVRFNGHGASTDFRLTEPT
jgi:hypothetical protein